MLIGVETAPKIKLTYFPSEKQARKWCKKHQNCEILIVPDNKKPTKIDLDHIWHTVGKMTIEGLQLHWYQQHKVGIFAEATPIETLTRRKDSE